MSRGEDIAGVALKNLRRQALHQVLQERWPASETTMPGIDPDKALPASATLLALDHNGRTGAIIEVSGDDFANVEARALVISAAPAAVRVALALHQLEADLRSLNFRGQRLTYVADALDKLGPDVAAVVAALEDGR